MEDAAFLLGKVALKPEGDFRSIRPVRQVLLVYLFRVVQDTLHGLGCSDGKEVVRESGGHLTSFRPKLLPGVLLTHAAGASGRGGGQQRGREDRGPGASRGGIQEGGGEDRGEGKAAL